MGMIFKSDYNLNLDVLNKCIKDGKILNSRLGLMLKCLARSINSDCIFSERLDEHDNFFIPKNETEQILWNNLRTSAKIQIRSIETNRQNGKKGGRPKKEEKAIQKPEPELPPIKIKMTEEEFLNWAKKMNDMAGVGGFKNTETQAAMFWNHFSSQGWRKKNGMPITDIKSAYKLWVLKDKKDEGEEEQIQKVEIEVD